MAEQQTPTRLADVPILRSMLSRAAHVTHPRGNSLVTETINGVTVQCEGRPTYRQTLDGQQPTVSMHWFIECRKASKAKVLALFHEPASTTPKD